MSSEKALKACPYAHMSSTREKMQVWITGRLRNLEKLSGRAKYPYQREICQWYTTSGAIVDLSGMRHDLVQEDLERWHF